MQYVDFNYYADKWCGELTNAQFDKLITKACDYIDAITFNRITDVTDIVKKSVCNVIDEMQRQNDITINGRVSSFSNDGYTENRSYGSDMRSNARKLRESAAFYLAQTNLLYRGVNDVRS